MVAAVFLSNTGGIYCDTLVTAKAASIKEGINVVTTGGRNIVGDNKGATYKYVAFGADNNARFTSASGRKFQVVRPEGISAWNTAWFGMDPANTGAENDAAWLGLLSVVQPFDEVYIPAGTYTFVTTTNFYPMELLTDGVVQLEGPVITNVVYTKVKRGSVRLRQTGTYFWAKPFERFPDPVDGRIKNDYISSAEVDDNEVAPEYMLQHLKPYRIAIDTDTFVAMANADITFSSELAVINTANLVSNNWVGVFDERPEVGAFYSCGQNKGASANVQSAFFVRTENSYRVYFQDPATPGAISCIQKATGNTATTRTIKPLTSNSENVPAFNMRNSSLGAYLTKHNEYIATINGVSIDGPVRAIGDESITAFGWGLYHPLGETGLLSLIRPYKNRNCQPPAPRPMTILCFGDSMTDPLVPGWPEHLTSALQGSLGCQIEGLSNIGASGHTSTQQLAILQSVNLAPYTMAVGMIGVNDQQTNFSHISFQTNINAMIDLFHAAGIPLVLMSPTPYYTTTQANVHGGAGFPTLLQEAGSQYRDTMIQTVGAARRLGKQVAIVDTGRALPPPLPQYLDWSLTGNRADVVVNDNVHQSMRVKAYLARAAAKAVLGLVCPRSRRAVPPQPFKTAWFRNTWEVVPDWHNNWSIDEQGIKHLRLFFRTTSGTAGNYANNVQIMQLPLFLAPSNALETPFVGGTKMALGYSGTTAATLNVYTTGEIRVSNIDTTLKWISADISYV